jgi:hypothetical protein
MRTINRTARQHRDHIKRQLLAMQVLRVAVQDRDAVTLELLHLENELVNLVSFIKG